MSYAKSHCKYFVGWEGEKHIINCGFIFFSSGKLARLPTLTSSQSVTFRHGTNVEFNAPGFPGAPPGPSADVAPIEGYNLQTVSTAKTRDFSNPMYDAVQSGTTTDPSLSNGSGKSIKNKFISL